MSASDTTARPAAGFYVLRIRDEDFVLQDDCDAFEYLGPTWHVGPFASEKAAWAWADANGDDPSWVVFHPDDAAEPLEGYQAIRPEEIH